MRAREGLGWAKGVTGEAGPAGGCSRRTCALIRQPMCLNETPLHYSGTGSVPQVLHYSTGHGMISTMHASK